MAEQPDRGGGVDRKLADVAREKLRTGKRPSREELAALRRWEKAEQERLRWEHYGACPKKIYLAMANRQAKVVNDQAMRYGLPVDGPIINLGAVIHWLHDFLASHKYSGDEEEESSIELDAAERLKEEQFLTARLKRLELEGQLVRRDLAREWLDGLAASLRNLRTELAAYPGAVQLLEELLDDWQRNLDDHFDGAPDDAESTSDV
jgi:hypothetical protein